ncbi:hypothetical protein CSA57_13620 [candidate division KSB3 bacterium]|nr:MAG: hypothetical protein CSA57_13620 [candidate division KSB3 bacterium]
MPFQPCLDSFCEVTNCIVCPVTHCIPGFNFISTYTEGQEGKYRLQDERMGDCSEFHFADMNHQILLFSLSLFYIFISLRFQLIN